MGSYLTQQGFKKGDVIAYLGTNNPEFALLLLGCASIGVTLTTANPAYTEGRNCRSRHAGNVRKSMCWLSYFHEQDGFFLADP